MKMFHCGEGVYCVRSKGQFQLTHMTRVEYTIFLHSNNQYAWELTGALTVS